jgi:hypothetical protein
MTSLALPSHLALHWLLLLHNSTTSEPSKTWHSYYMSYYLLNVPLLDHRDSMWCEDQRTRVERFD